MRRVALITEIISPYRIPLFNALARSGVDLHVIFLSETDPSLRQWRVYKEEIRFSYEVLPAWRKRIGRYNSLLNRGLARALKRRDAEAIICGGYNYLASWQALAWSRLHGIPFLLWSESNLADMRSGKRMVEFLKSFFLRQCGGYVVAGQSSRDYLKSHGLREEKIFTAPDAVDNELFASVAKCARSKAEQNRRELGLPARFFLFSGRLVREKGVFDLLGAYGRLKNPLREQVGLVYVGEGAAREELEQQAAAISPGSIRFAGFVQRDELARYYALADMLILPTYSDPWGLVVNEAMACGLPIIVSRVAGCAADLVKNGGNGFLISAGDVSSLATCMEKLACDSEMRMEMGRNSQTHILLSSPEAWASGVRGAIEATARQL